MSILPMPEDSPFRRWTNKQNGAMSQPMVEPNPVGIQDSIPGQVPVQQAPQQQAPQQQAALQQAISGPSFEESLGGTNLRGGNVSQVKGAKSAVGNIASGAMTGASMGSIVPGIGTGIGAGIGAAVGGIKSLFGTRKNQLTDMARPDFDKNVAAAYRTYLGREASPEEIRNIHPNSGKYVNENMYSSTFKDIQNSQEAKAYAARGAQPQAAPAADPAAQQQAAVAQAVAGPPAGGKGGILEGFSSDKMGMGMDKQMKSPKYAFAAVAQKYDQSDPAQRQAMLAELKQHPSGYFKNAQLTGSKGDILDVGETNDPVWGGIRKFDVIRAAGEGGKAWQWGALGGDSGGGPGGGGGGLDYGQGQYSGAGDPVLAAINGQSLNPVSAGMARLQELLKNIPGGINGIANGGL